MCGRIVLVCCCHRSKSIAGLKERVKRSVTPIFLTAIGNGLASPQLDFNSRSLRIASSFFPRGFDCPPIALLWF